MKNADTDNVMRAVAHILAVTVLLDRRQKDQEMIEFCHSVMTINQRLRPGVILPRQTILSWYEAEREKIAIALADDTDDTFKTQALEKIRDPELRRSVLASIFAICICDYEFQDEEAAFIKIALNIWKSGMPSLDEMTLIAG